MNISELARKLRISVQELREILPHLGFDIGSKAIKIDNVIAHRILKNWQRLYKEYTSEQEKLKKEKEDALKQNEGDVEKEKKIIHIPPFITVKDFSHKLGAPLVDVMQELMKNGVLATLNDEIDYDTATIIGDEFDCKVESQESDIDIKEESNENVQDIVDKEDKKLLKSRPPVVVVMGHVDHGKTKLLDAIRKTNVIDKEAGGITQHIGAYQVKKSVSNVKDAKKERIITFIDTPGHEAFTAMRSRGAKIADIAILVVAADDGVKPQTKEALKIIEQTGIPMIVAINKIDKPESNIEKTKQELSALNVIPEDWGGKAVCVPISAKAGTGIDELLETIILITDLNEDKIKSNPNSTGLGTVIESHIDRGEGPVATILIQNGSVRKQEYIFVNGDIYGRIRLMKNYLGKEISIADPSTPIKVIGLKILPKVGDIIKTNIIKILLHPKKMTIMKYLKKQVKLVLKELLVDLKRNDRQMKLIIKVRK
ncbi:translation initiation factor IF-2 [Patescibacteria group bacterium]